MDYLIQAIVEDRIEEPRAEANAWRLRRVAGAAVGRGRLWNGTRAAKAHRPPSLVAPQGAVNAPLCSPKDFEKDE